MAGQVSPPRCCPCPSGTSSLDQVSSETPLEPIHQGVAPGVLYAVFLGDEIVSRTADLFSTRLHTFSFTPDTDCPLTPGAFIPDATCANKSRSSCVGGRLNILSLLVLEIRFIRT